MTTNKLRINKYLSLCGLGSRRKTEILVKKGLITVNGKVMTDLSYIVDLENDEVVYAGRILSPTTTLHYIMMNKPKGFITSTKDERNRPTVFSLIPEQYKQCGVFPVGRLDKDTEGLLIFTNDGDLAYKLTHPRFQIPKTYIVILDKPLRDDHKAALEKGIELYGKKTLPTTIVPLNEEWTIVSMTLIEGKKRQIRMMFATVGYFVIALTRIQYGPLTLGDLPLGSWRKLTTDEIEKLRSLVH